MAAQDGYLECAETIGGKFGAVEIEITRNTVYLPHSCDDWIIGDADDVRALIIDLEAALSVIAPPEEVRQ